MKNGEIIQRDDAQRNETATRIISSAVLRLQHLQKRAGEIRIDETTT
jgi:hypothetical protein